MTSDPARRIAAHLRRRGLAAPARLLLEAHLPLAPLAADMGAALGPLARAAGGRIGGDMVALLERTEGLERLVEALDESAELDAQPG